MWLQLILFIFGLLFVIATAIILVKLSKGIKKINVRPNAPKLEINSLSKTAFTEGYARGTIKSQKRCKNDCTRIEFFPEDVEQGENIERPDIKCFVVKDTFIKRYAEGESGSARRQIIEILPRSNKDLPEQKRGTEEGNRLTRDGQKAWIEAMAGKMITAGDEAIGEMLTDYARGGISKASFEQMKEETAQIKKLRTITESAVEEKKGELK